jgi:2-methylcitrate dehydratase PrpD
MTNEHYQRGFHATGSLALFSALATLIKLYGLDVATARQAFGIAGSMASGLRRNFGTMTKPPAHGARGPQRAHGVSPRHVRVHRRAGHLRGEGGILRGVRHRGFGP